MRKRLLAGAAAILLSGTFAIGAFADAKPQDMSSETRAKMMQSFCTDRTAHAAGRLAYLEAKLKPTAAQQAAWKKYSDAVTADATAREKECLARPARNDGKGERPSIVERQAMMEKGLEARLASLKATTPALQSLYATLSDEQKAVLDRAQGPGGPRHFTKWRGHGDGDRGMMHKAHFNGDRMGPPDEPDAGDAPDAPPPPPAE